MAKKKTVKVEIDQTEKREKLGNARILEHEAHRKRICTRLKAVKSKESKWRKEAKEDIAFYRGVQWDTADKRTLEEQGRPCLTFNEIKPVIDVVQGYFRRNSGRIRVNPIGAEDQVFSEVFDRILKHIDRKTKLEFKLGYVFDTGITAGKDYLEMVRSFDQDPVFGHLKAVKLGPWRVYVDPNSKEYDYNEDADWIIKEGRFSKGKLKLMYPDAAKRIDAIDDDDNDNTPEFTDAALEEILSESDDDNYDLAGLEPGGVRTSIDQPFMEETKEGDEAMFTLLEEWCKKTVKQWFVYYTERGTYEMYDTEDAANKASEAEMAQRRQVEAMAMASERFPDNTLEGVQQAANFADELLSSPEAAKAIRITPNKVMEKTVPLMYVTVMVGGFIVAHGKSPLLPEYNGFPIFRYIADWFPDAEEEKDRVHGFVRQIKDPQREVNKSRSSMLHIIATGANSGWVVDEDMNPDMIKKLENMGSMPGIVVKKPKGTEATRIQAVPSPVAQINREQMASESIRKVSGVNADLMGAQDSNSDSGRQMALRIRQAILALEKAFVNFRYTKEILGTAIFKMIPSLFNASKVRRILGEAYMQENELDLGKLKAFLQLVRDGEYDLTITDSEDSETIRQETFEALMTMAEKGMPVPPDVIMEFSPISNKNEIKRRIQEFAQSQAAAQGAQK